DDRFNDIGATVKKQDKTTLDLIHEDAQPLTPEETTLPERWKKAHPNVMYPMAPDFPQKDDADVLDLDLDLYLGSNPVAEAQEALEDRRGILGKRREPKPLNEKSGPRFQA